MRVEEIPVDLTATGGLLPMGTATAAQIENLAAGQPAAASTEAPATQPQIGAPVLPVSGDKPVVTLCRHCNMSSDVDPAEPTKDDIYAFSQAVWRDARFSKTYQLFGAAADVTFRTLTFDEEQAVEAAVDRERLDGKLAKDAFAMIMRLGELRLPLMIARLRIGGYIMDRPPPEDPFTYDLASEFTLIRKGPLKNVAVANTVGQLFRSFSKLAETLTNRALDKSFWQATDRVGFSPDSPPPATQG